MKKSVHSCPGKDDVPTPREFANLDWLATLIYHVPSVSNLRTDSSLRAEGDHKLSEEEGEKRADFSEGDDVEGSEVDGSRSKDDESSFSGDLPVGSEDNSPERDWIPRKSRTAAHSFSAEMRENSV